MRGAAAAHCAPLLPRNCSARYPSRPNPHRETPARQVGLGLLVDAPCVAHAHRQQAWQPTRRRARRRRREGSPPRSGPRSRRPCTSRRRCLLPASSHSLVGIEHEAPAHTGPGQRGIARGCEVVLPGRRGTDAPGASAARGGVASRDPVSRTTISSTHGRTLARQRPMQRASSRTIITSAARRRHRAIVATAWPLQPGRQLPIWGDLGADRPSAERTGIRIPPNCKRMLKSPPALRYASQRTLHFGVVVRLAGRWRCERTRCVMQRLTSAGVAAAGSLLQAAVVKGNRRPEGAFPEPGSSPAARPEVIQPQGVF